MKPVYTGLKTFPKALLNFSYVQWGISGLSCCIIVLRTIPRPEFVNHISANCTVLLLHDSEGCVLFIWFLEISFCYYMYLSCCLKRIQTLLLDLFLTYTNSFVSLQLPITLCIKLNTHSWHTMLPVPWTLRYIIVHQAIFLRFGCYDGPVLNANLLYFSRWRVAFYPGPDPSRL